ncbi:MAG: hypothetical protein ACI9DC_001320 [Gammaproteobacteria bacterium]|jgi:hypothetical protein
MLGTHALGRGYMAWLYTFNLQVFELTWFDRRGSEEPRFLMDNLSQQQESKSGVGAADCRLLVATVSYLEFLPLGGVIRLRELNSRLISSYVTKGLPILTGLSATFLYRCAREYGSHDDYDDIRGERAGHFVVVHGYDRRTRHVTVADPLAGNPGFSSQQYSVSMSRLVASIMLGVLTHDANLLVIEPRERGHADTA